MDIRCDFDSGNIQVIDASDPQRVLLALRPDLKSPHFQWFHFRVDGLQPGQRYGFSLTNAGQSSYTGGWPGYRALASYDQRDWFRVPSEYDGQALHFSLDAERPQAWFAYFEPYSRERHAALIERALKQDGVELLASGNSLEGRDIPLLRVRRNPQATRKLWLIAQQHPGEHMAEWFMEGLIERLERRDDPELEHLLAHAELYLVPNMNPDGAFRGHLRTNAAGTDLNRAWQAPSAEASPEVLFVQAQMRRHGVDLFLDIHGDEEIPYVFAAGCEGNPGYTPRQAHLEQAFRERLEARGEFQSVHGYPRSAPGQANMSLACNFVGETYQCLALTLEMPFKDHDLAPDARHGWSGERAKRLAGAVLSTLASLVLDLR
ncbi:M14 family metallopeptidase [Pseudomonas panipatensis]|uniref:Murein tripeptide amidase MpaA n=1 Tax=Pseudomonas panipatensis TaxID=428992 RepID=A0A1G8FEG0_9PSED|nr:M14-type cytosolic carboxypeptidase [Pseudomonas panipatensis]SDH80507.1 Murein tripeptide amidase MpaA [Pseudomonas panipatensis]SMP54246.1 Murein tripeptide amidase MpaA [Pseudomonas panipatensis]